jgi:uncharacterized surface protein with fasciclin (FAS1) repeats
MDGNKTVGIVVAVVAVIAIAGGVWWYVGKDDSTTNESSNNTSQVTEEQVEQAKDIVATAVAASQLSTLVTAVQAADLVTALQQQGPLTVLAPTNDAFANLPAGTLDTLLKPENKSQLSNILTYHVISGKALSSDLTDGQVITTLQGQNLTVDIVDGKVYFIDAKGGKAMVTTADVEASNGVVHIIDAVLLPQ